ncbi:Hsp20/alpha crystallin family protein [Cohnella caldifontis]|uniref:Hsp20/alpha crystallin family protein n=1 Tax=Cohnella caldifontis TaxID=3027471 RepID=UPI0023EA8161|nr:Hsp20/alpha crystallin family protein [Cohnella sp. YIM B05605]
MEADRGKLPKHVFDQAGEVLGEEFWQEMSELIPVAGPRIDMYHEPAAVVVLAELPGLLSPDQIGIRLEGQTLELEGELPCPYPVTENRIVRRERFFGVFKRSLALPKPVVAEAVKARYAKGLLIIELPIAEAESLTRIPVEFEPPASRANGKGESPSDGGSGDIE